VTDTYTKINLLKSLYGEICLGFSEFEHSGKPIFIRHFTEIENGMLNKKRETFLKEAVEKGLDQKEDKLIFLMRENIWDRENEIRIESLKKQISDTNLILQNLIVKKQINETKSRIKLLETEASELEKEKSYLLGFCAEDYAEKLFNELFIFQAFFKNEDLKERYFTKEEFEELDEIELTDLVRSLNLFYQKFSLKEIKRVAACSFLMSLFHLCNDNAYYFYGKYIKDLTVFQANLFSQCKYFKSLIQNKAQANPPEDVSEDPDKMIDWYEMVINSDIGKADDNVLGVGHIGASTEELQKMAGGGASTLSEIAKKKGNKLTREDFIKMHGI
jgi:hypothetical protein